MRPINNTTEKIYMSPEYAGASLPGTASRVKHAEALRDEGFCIVFGAVGDSESFSTLFSSELRFSSPRFVGELLLGPYVTWSDSVDSAPFTPYGLAIWQRQPNQA